MYPVNLPPFAPHPPWYKQLWPWLLLLGPMAAVVAGIITMWLAFSGMDSLVSDEYYKDGVAVNRLFRRDKVALDLGVQTNIRREGKELQVRLSLAADEKLPQQLILSLTHPTQSRKDRILTMEQRGDGLYQARLEDTLTPGKWYLTLEDAEKKWRVKKTIVVTAIGLEP